MILTQLVYNPSSQSYNLTKPQLIYEPDLLNTKMKLTQLVYNPSPQSYNLINPNSCTNQIC